MQGKLFQPVVFNLITIVAMIFSLFQLMAISYRNQVQNGGTATTEVIEQFEKLVAEGEFEDETLIVRLADERDQRMRFGSYVMVAQLFAIMANIVANYLGRGRHFRNTARINELEAEIRGMRRGD